MFRLFKTVSASQLLIILLAISQVFCGSDEDKIQPEVKEQFENGEQPGVVIVQCTTPASPNLGDTFATLLRLENENRVLLDVLQNLISSTLQGLADPLKLLDSSKAIYSVAWINNWIIIYKPTLPLLLKLVVFDIVITIGLDQRIPNFQPPIIFPRSPPPDNGAPWNINLINARCANIPCNGTNVTIGILAGGVMLEHEQLNTSWIGEPYGWFDANDPISPSGPKPSDPSFNSRGTMVAGIALGKTVGVAPGSKWIACNACTPDGLCSRAAITLCGHWMICPWKWNDVSVNRATMDCAKKPNILLYALRNFVGGQFLNDDPFYFYPVLKILNHVGILSVFPMGDNGPNCNSGSAPGNYENALAVGSVDFRVVVTALSSRGPTIINKSPFNVNSTAKGTCPAFEGSARQCTATSDGDVICTLIKPDIVAPGEQIFTSLNKNSTAYDITDGTPFAAAHVAGVMALMICSNPKVTWNYQKAYKILTENADRSRINVVGSGETETLTDIFAERSHLFCNYILSHICNGFPNNLYGYGLVDACQAVKAAMMLKP